MLTDAQIRKIKPLEKKKRYSDEKGLYLEVTPAFMYNLNMWATFDPYAKMSERWFTIVPDGILAEIKKNSKKKVRTILSAWGTRPAPFLSHLTAGAG